MTIRVFKIGELIKHRKVAERYIKAPTLLSVDAQRKEIRRRLEEQGLSKREIASQIGFHIRYKQGEDRIVREEVSEWHLAFFTLRNKELAELQTVLLPLLSTRSDINLSIRSQSFQMVSISYTCQPTVNLICVP